MKTTTLVLGASLNTSRYSNIVIHKLRSYKHPTVAIGLKKGLVNDVNIETELISYQNINTVTLYLNPQRQQQYYNYIIELQPQRVIFNPGTENQEFYKLLKAQGITVEVACTLVLLTTNQY